MIVELLVPVVDVASVLETMGDDEFACDHIQRLADSMPKTTAAIILTEAYGLKKALVASSTAVHG